MKWLTWVLFYIVVIGRTVLDCQKTLAMHSIEKYEIFGMWAITFLIIGVFISVFWNIGWVFFSMSLIDRLEVWIAKIFKFDPIRPLSFEFLRRR